MTEDVLLQDKIEESASDPRTLALVAQRDAALEKHDRELADRQANLEERYESPELEDYAAELLAVAEVQREQIEQQFALKQYELEAKLLEENSLERRETERNELQAEIQRDRQRQEQLEREQTREL